MAVIGLVCADAEDRRRLSLIAGESGHQVHGAGRLHEAVEILTTLGPRLMLVVDSPEQDAGVFVRELRRAAPLLPVVVALKDRDSSRAVSLMRAGAAEVVPPPWTRESVKACVSKSLRYQGTTLSLRRVPRPRAVLIFLAAVLIFLGSVFGYKTVRRAERVNAERAAVQARAHWDLPYVHASAMTFADGKIWIADWFTQSVYVHDPVSISVEHVSHFPAEMPVALAVGGETVWSATAGGVVVRRAKDLALTALQRSPVSAAAGLAFDGLYLWTADGAKLRKRLPDAQLSEVEAYKYPGGKVAGLIWDGKALWSLDAANRELLRHDALRGDRVTARLPLIEYSAGGYRPVAAGFDGRLFWSIGEKMPVGSRSRPAFPPWAP